MALREILRLGARWWWLTAAYVAVGIIGSLFVSAVTRPVYRAEVTIVVTQDVPDADQANYTVLLAAESVANTYARLLKSSALLETVAARTGAGTTAKELGKRVRVEPLAGTALINLSVDDSTRDSAESTADEIVNQFGLLLTRQGNERYIAARAKVQDEIYSASQELERVTDALDALDDPTVDPVGQARKGLDAKHKTLEASLRQLQGTLQSLDAHHVAAGSGISALPAEAGTDPVRPQPLQEMLFAALLGAVLSVFAAVLSERVDRSVSSLEVVHAATGLPVVGLLPVSATSFEEAEPLSRYASEASSTLRANLQFAGLDRPVRRILVSGPGTGEGKTTCAANLAVSLAQSGARVLLIDANLRHPSVHTYFGVANDGGLCAALLLGSGAARAVVQPTETEGLSVLPSGPVPPTMAHLFHTLRMSALMSELGDMADILVLDGPGALGISDALVLADLCDTTVLVADTTKTRSRELARSAQILGRSSTRLAGVVLNRTTASAGYYYSDGAERTFRSRLPWVGVRTA